MNSLSTEESAVASLIARVADEYAKCRNMGQQPNVDAYVADYPELEGIIRQVVSSLEFINDFTVNSSDGTEQKARGTNPTTPTRLGEFRILREIGRGGMGVVYEAKQESLGRTVALKILPFAASLDPMKLKRFQIETQAVATLRHPNIVQIYGTGCEQGVHYYAMEYIRGVTLDRVVQNHLVPARSKSGIGRQRTSPMAGWTTSKMEVDERSSHRSKESGEETGRPADTDDQLAAEPFYFDFAELHWRDIAKLGIQIADALQHAHQHGVIHRDVKPSNLIFDREHRVWITDFGLAHIGKGAALTMTGDIVGTLCYMSPEQALSDLGPIDHRTDIYSLGATLYELLTLRPLFDGTDHKTLIRQMAFEEPRAPRRIDKSIPRDLETIVLKAIARNRDDRYPTAQELAQDLHLFLEDRPIRARRPTVSQRMARWSRRHKSAVGATALLFLLVSVGLLVSNIAVATQRNKAKAALEKSQLNESRAILEASKAKAVSDVLQELLASANPDQLKGNEYTVRQLLDNVSETLLSQLDDQPEVKATLSSIVGNAYRRLGMPRKAAPHLLTAMEFWQTKKNANSLQHAKCLEDLAWNEAAQSRYPTAESYAREAVEMMRTNDQKGVALLHALWCHQHSLIYQAKYAEADAIAEQALALAGTFANPPPETGNILHNLAQSKNLQRKYAEGEELARRAVEIHKQLQGEAHTETAWGLDALGRALYYQRKFAEAERVFREALSIFQHHYGNEHKSVQLTYDYLRAVLKHAQKQESIEQLDHERFASALRPFFAKNSAGQTLLDFLDAKGHTNLAARIVLEAPESIQDYDQCLKAVDILARSGQAIEANSESDDSEPRWITVSREFLESAVESCPDDPNAKNSVAWALVSNPDSRLHDGARAIPLAEDATEQSPKVGHFWITLGIAYYRAGEYDKSMEALDNALRRQSANEYALLFLAMSHEKLGAHPMALVKFEQAKSMYERRTTPEAELTRFYEEAKAVFVDD